MRTVDFRKVVEEIISSHGWTESDLARRLEITPSAIHKIRTGMTAQPGYALGAELVRLHDARPTQKGRARK